MNFSFFELSLPDDDPVYTLKKVMEDLDFQKYGCKNPDKGFLQPKINFIFYRKKDPLQGKRLTGRILVGMSKCAINRHPLFYEKKCKMKSILLINANSVKVKPLAFH